MSRSDDWNPLRRKWIFRSEDCELGSPYPLGQPLRSSVCLMSVNDLFQLCAVFHTIPDKFSGWQERLSGIM